MFYVTADPHGDFRHIRRFAKGEGLTRDDVIVVLGDAGINYFMNERDRQVKKLISKIPATIFCIHGNHEARPQSLPNLYREAEWRGGTVFMEDTVPNLLFARDGELYGLDGLRTLVVGGAYSVDKFYRLSRGWSWFADEQPDDDVKRRVEEKLDEVGWEADCVLTHTCPHRVEPTEAFIEGIDQSSVDKTTELWLDFIEARLDYKLWYVGHWHIEKDIERFRFRFHSIEPFGEDLPQP